MGAIKSEIYREDLIEFAEILKAIAHPARLRMIEIMIEKTDEPVSTHAFLADIPLSQSAISQHLHKLTSVGILATRSGTQNGRYCQIYEFDFRTVELLVEYLRKLSACIENRASKEAMVIDHYYSRFSVVLKQRWKEVNHPRIV